MPGSHPLGQQAAAQGVNRPSQRNRRPTTLLWCQPCWTTVLRNRLMPSRACTVGQPTATPVLDLPCPSAQRVGAPGADDDLRVVAEVHQSRRVFDGPAAPAL